MLFDFVLQLWGRLAAILLSYSAWQVHEVLVGSVVRAAGLIVASLLVVSSVL